MGRKFGVSFSWKRATGVSAFKGKVSRSIGIPLTRSGRERKAGRLLLGVFPLYGAGVGRRHSTTAYEASGAAAGERSAIASLVVALAWISITAFVAVKADADYKMWAIAPGEIAALALRDWNAARRPAVHHAHASLAERFWRFLGLLLFLIGVALASAGAIGVVNGREFLPLAIPGCIASLPFLGVGARLRWPRARKKGPPPLPRPTAPRRTAHTGLHFEDFRFAEPLPTKKQVGYALSLGVQVCNGMNRVTLSDAITDATERLRSAGPASREQLADIKKMHCVLTRAVSYGEATTLIEHLEQVTIECPKCGIPNCSDDQRCCSCGKSFSSVRIQV
jgi:hypothetical protein